MADRSQAELRDLERIQERVLGALGGAGAERLQPAVLQPAGELLERYGEELRGRACVVSDAHGGELFLLPDYTVPICRMRREKGGRPGRFVYAGPVFRLPGSGDGRMPVEERQAGLEVFEAAGSPESDSDVLSRAIEAVRSVGGRPSVTLGDAALGPAILGSFEISERRRSRLLRRLGHPERFRALLQRFVRAERGGERRESLEPFAPAEGAAEALEGVLAARGIPQVGRRGSGEVAARLAELAAERDEPPLPAETAERIDSLLSLRGSLFPTLDTLADAARDSSVLSGAMARLESRARRLAEAGFGPGDLALDLRLGGDVGYYDGMVFEVRVEGRLVASGGRYDRLARDSGLSLAAVGAAVWVERLLGAGAGET